MGELVSGHRKTSSCHSDKTLHRIYETFKLHFGCCSLNLRPQHIRYIFATTELSFQIDLIGVTTN